MVAWDLAMDPVWSTIMRGWIWLHGGPYFGVPVSNFLGWFLTVYVIYQLFALYLHRHPGSRSALPSSQIRIAVLFYGVSAIGNLAIIPGAGHSLVADPSGTQWKVSGIVTATAVVSIFVMGAFTLFAWRRLSSRTSLAGIASPPAR